MNYQKKAMAVLLKQMRANGGKIEVEQGSQADKVLAKSLDVIRSTTQWSKDPVTVEYLLKPKSEAANA